MGPTGFTGPTGQIGVLDSRGGTYISPNPFIGVTAASDTTFFVAQQNITTNTTTAKYLITITYTIQSANSPLFATVGRQNNGNNPQVAASTFNLADATLGYISNNNIGTPNYFATTHYANSTASTVSGTIIVIDTPNFIGTVSYGLWIRSKTCNIVKYNITVLQILT
jgi:hypothetical protein